MRVSWFAGGVVIVLVTAVGTLAQPRRTRADAIHEKGAKLMAAGQLKEAVVAFQEAIAEDPQHTDSLADLTWIRATAELDELRNPDEAVALGERMVRSVLVRYNNRWTGDERVIQQPWELPADARQAQGFPQSPGFYRVMIFSSMAAAYASAGRFRPEETGGVARDRAVANGIEPNAEAYGELAAEQAEHELKSNPSAENKAMVARTREHLAMYRNSKPLRGAPKP